MDKKDKVRLTLNYLGPYSQDFILFLKLFSFLTYKLDQ
jgi:hypothetical protein